MSKHRPILFGLVVTAATLMGSASHAEPVTIRIRYAATGLDDRAYPEGTSAATAGAGSDVEEEFKTDPDIKVEWSFFKGAGPAVNEGMVTNQRDFAYEGDLPSILGRANGLKTKILLASGARKPTDIATPIASTIVSVKELKGHKVAVQRGTTCHLSFVNILEANRLQERDLPVINMDEATSNAALASNQIDAAVGDTTLIKLSERNLAKILYTTKGDDPCLGRYGHVLVTETFAQAHPDLTQRVTTAFVRAAYWSCEEADRDAVSDLWTKAGTPKPVLAEFFAGDRLKDRNAPVMEDLSSEHYRDAAAKSKEFGFLRRDVNLDGWFDAKDLDMAIRDLNLEGYCGALFSGRSAGDALIGQAYCDDRSGRRHRPLLSLQ